MHAAHQFITDFIVSSSSKRQARFKVSIHFTLPKKYKSSLSTLLSHFYLCKQTYPLD